jgi:hypothetical protein
MHPEVNFHNKQEQSNDLRKAIAEGLIYAHKRLDLNTSKTLEAAAFLYALVELLDEKGIIGIDELDDRKRVVGQRLIEQWRQSGNGVMLQEPEFDKYDFEQEVVIDCENRVHLCRAACCRLPFALSKQDIREGVIQWELGRPYLIDHRQDGYCCHLDKDSFGCTVHKYRPVPCRGYDCRSDGRIWLDFENKVVNPAIQQPDWPFSLETEEKVESVS